MNFFADEGLDVPLALALRERGFNIVHALDMMRGSDDEAFLREAVSRDAILLTKDKDFGEMVIRHTLHCRGVVPIRIDDLKNTENLGQVVELLSHYHHQLPDHFTVIQTDKIRIRKL